MTKSGTPTLPGESNPSSVLTEVEVAGIRRQYEAGDVTQRELAEQYGVGRSTIGDVVRYNRWKHVDPMDYRGTGVVDGELRRWIPGWEGLYEATSDGHIISHHRSPRELKTPPNSEGYCQVNLCRDGEAVNRHVHSLVAATFHGPRPDGLEVLHLDGNRSNNSASNLAYGTRWGGVDEEG